MADDTDDWPIYNIGSKDHLHAVGVLVANWALVEQSYQVLIQYTFHPDIGLGLRVNELLGNESKWALIADETIKRAEPQFEPHIAYFLKCAAICKENRNAVAHAKFGADQDPEFITLDKGRDRRKAKLKLYRFSVVAIREMADEVHSVANYGMQIWGLMEVSRARKQTPKLRLPDHFVLASQVPLLAKPPQPRKWNLRSQERIEDVQPPPRSSQE